MPIDIVELAMQDIEASVHRAQVAVIEQLNEPPPADPLAGESPEAILAYIEGHLGEVPPEDREVAMGIIKRIMEGD